MKRLLLACILFGSLLILLWGNPNGTFLDDGVSARQSVSIDVTHLPSIWREVIDKLKTAPERTYYTLYLPDVDKTVPKEVIQVIALRKIIVNFVEPSGYQYSLYGEEVVPTDLTRSVYTYRQLENLSALSSMRRAERQKTSSSSSVPSHSQSTASSGASSVSSAASAVSSSQAASSSDSDRIQNHRIPRPVSFGPQEPAFGMEPYPFPEDLLTKKAQSDASSVPAEQSSSALVQETAVSSESHAVQSESLRPLGLADVAFVFLSLGMLIPLGFILLFWLIIPKKRR